MTRTRIRIVGASGSGILSMGTIVSRALRNIGFHVCTDREYPSLIKGGHSCVTINFSTEPVWGLSDTADILVGMDKPSLKAYFSSLREGGTFVHGYERLAGIRDYLDQAKEKNITIAHLRGRETARELGGTDLMENMVLTGMLWKVLGLSYKEIKKEVEHKFAKKPKLLELDLKCLEAGYEKVESSFDLELPTKKEEHLLLDGNHALALGAVHAGVRAYFAYPMSPASSILTHLKRMETRTGMMVKQAEDEITVANLALGAMYMGTRALCATSGGGYDLMTETISLAGILENPLVTIIVQRPGPATGLPTWTGQGDLNLAIFSSHGEFARIVVAVSDPANAFDVIQHAFNYAEKYQVPIVILSEKVIAESIMTVPVFDQKKIPIERGLVEGKDLEKLENSDRFKITDSGLSKRWIPGSSDAYYFANGDEHWEDGRLEEGERAGEMYEKRCRKLNLIRENLPEPEIFGVEKDADISFVGWGSTKCIMRDMILEFEKKGVKVNYLHFEYVWPLRTEKFQTFCKENKNVHLIEGNHDGQLGGLLKRETGLDFKGRFLKWNGRPFFIEDVTDYIQKNG